MMTLNALTLMVLLADPSGAGWEKAAEEDNLTVYSREKKGGVQEMKAEGLIDAPPEKVWKALRDYENYKKTMPYTKVSTVVAREGGDKVVWFYTVVAAPLVDKRDYVIKLVDESKWADGKGYLKVSWTADSSKAPKKPDDVVRVEINDGYWLLEPREEGKKTFAVYYVYTDPGGSIPRWLVNRANSSAVPDVFEAVRKAAR